MPSWYWPPARPDPPPPRRPITMVKPAMPVTPKTTDYRTVDLAWFRRKGARHVGDSGQITWRRRGEVTGSIGYRLEPRGLRLHYPNTPYGGMPEDVNDLIPIVTTRMQFGGVGHWFLCPSCGRRCRILYGGARFRCRCAEALGTKASIKLSP